MREKPGNIVAVTDDVLLQAQWTQWLTWNHSNLLRCGWDFNSRAPFVYGFVFGKQKQELCTPDFTSRA